MTFKQAVAEYTGREVMSVQVHPDPKVSGTYAIRAVLKRGKKTETIDFLHVSGMSNADVSPDTLEECTFESWPPKSGGLKLFW